MKREFIGLFFFLRGIVKKLVLEGGGSKERMILKYIECEVLVE